MLENYNVQILSSLEYCLKQVVYKIIKQIKAIQGKVTDPAKIKIIIQQTLNVYYFMIRAGYHPVTVDNIFSDK